MQGQQMEPGATSSLKVPSMLPYAGSLPRAHASSGISTGIIGTWLLVRTCRGANESQERAAQEPRKQEDKDVAEKVRIY